ncbi:MAG TPA: hypothetical protein VIW64_16180 [Pyrinomonadaceae bacterium]|jgi:hypothetical protein
MGERVTDEVILAGGYVDGKGVRHNRVVFGHRVTAKEMLDLDSDRMAQIPTQRADLIVAKEIIEFGTLKMPVPLSVLLDLVDADREDLMAAENEFAEKSSAGRSVVVRDDGATLAFGFKINDVVYTEVEFGTHNTGRDSVEADKLQLTGLGRECFLIGKQISRLKTADGAGVIDGPIALKDFDALEDGMDIVVLRGAAYLWRQTFRIGRGQVSSNGRGPDGANPGNENRLERGSDSGNVAGAS